MGLQIYDSAMREQREFVPLHEGEARIYLCGATVQGSPHIGHMRSSLAFDVMRRWLGKLGYRTTLVRNVTDIDDKILAKSAEAGQPWWAWAWRFEQEFTAAYNALGVIPPTYEPRATGHIPQMQALIADLIAQGHAYTGEPGNVYFDVNSWPQYGELTRQSVENMVADETELEPDKRHPHDFALWKAHKPDEPETAAWDSPWGRGRPGWHIECSAMSTHYLGDEFDIHGGGIDLRFPHHENEVAQARAAGRPFARYWMHNAWVTIKGEKMSKSLGNSLVVASVLEEVRPVVLRFLLGTVHYRSTVEYSPESLAEAASVWERLEGFVSRAVDAVGEVPAEEVRGVPVEELPEKFTEAMNDDLNVSAALAVIHEEVRRGNNALAERDDLEIRDAQLVVRAMLDVLGLDPFAKPWRHEATGATHENEALNILVEKMLDGREKARAAKDWAVADSIRDSLQEAGISVEDSADGVHWHF